jgi:uncharacterized membrane protein
MYSKEKNYETILAILLGLLVIYLFTGVRILITIGAVLALTGLLSQTIAGWITWGWLKLSHVMGFIMSKILLAVVFFVILFPISLLARLTRKDELMKKKTTGSTYYSERQHQYVAEDLTNPW